MHKYRTILFSLISFLLVFSTVILGQESTTKNNYPKNYEKYHFTLYGGVNLLSPYQVISSDNNWEILLACLSEKTKNDLP